MLPQRLVNGAATLTTGSSILSAELSAIAQALSWVYAEDEYYSMVAVFTDSSSAVHCLKNASHENPLVGEITRHGRNLRSAGTSTKVCWIPSHCGIQGNEEADSLAKEEAAHPSGRRILNQLTATEKIAAFKRRWKGDWINSCHTGRNSMNVTGRNKVGPLPWHIHPHRPTVVALHRLRSGHCRLNGFMYRTRLSPVENCPIDGCQEPEDPHHILLVCPAYATQRERLLRICDTNNISFNLPTILGLDPITSSAVNTSLRNALHKFLTITGLIHRI